MVLKKCYYVVYRTADYSDENKTKVHEDAYFDYTNALLVAQELTKCLDIIGNTSVIDGFTGEVLDEFECDNIAASVAEKTKEEAPSIIRETFKDKNGGIWYLTDDGKWDYECANRDCLDCIYYDKSRCCEVVAPLCEEDRNYLIELAKERITKANKLATTNDSFEDGLGGTWRKNKEDELWNYDCSTMQCPECPYNCTYGSCGTNSLTLHEVEELIAGVQERIGK